MVVAAWRQDTGQGRGAEGEDKVWTVRFTTREMRDETECVWGRVEAANIIVPTLPGLVSTVHYL